MMKDLPSNQRRNWMGGGVVDGSTPVTLGVRNAIKTN
jgi:hypothetical protein